MAEIDDKIRAVMSEMAKRRWAKRTPEERRAYGMFLVASRKKKRMEGGDANDAGDNRDRPRIQPAFRQVISPAPRPRLGVAPVNATEQDGEKLVATAGQSSRENSLCFRCRSGYHDRCLGPSCGCGCVEKPEWN